MTSHFLFFLSSCTHMKIKCHRYWPESGAAMYNQLQVVLHAVNEYPDYVLREFKLIDTAVSAVRDFSPMGLPILKQIPFVHVILL